MKHTLLLFLCLTFALPSFGQAGAGTETVFYVVTAVDASFNESGFSNEASAIVTPLHNKVNLTWTESGTVTGFNAYRSKVTGGPYTKINTTLILTTSFSDTITFPPTPTTLTAIVP